MSEKLEKKLARQIKAREVAEDLLENKARELFYINRKLEHQYKEISVLFAITNLDAANSTKKYLQDYIKILCEKMEWALGHIYFVENDKLHSSEIWSCQDIAAYQELINTTQKTNFSIGEGLPGHCLKQQHEVWIEDIIDDQGSPRSEVIKKSNIHTAFATPLYLNNAIFAIAEFFLTSPMPKNDGLLTIANNAGKQISLLLQKRKTDKELENKNQELTKTISKLKETQAQLVQSEKMASLGQLAAGVAHEINNPIGFVSGNFDTLSEYVDIFKQAIELSKKISPKNEANQKSNVEQLNEFLKEEDIDFVTEDMQSLLSSTKNGIIRIRDIVNNLRSFSRIDSSNSREESDINECIQNTLKIAVNQLKYHCDIIEKLSPLPKVCINAGQINQVILNLLINSGQAISENGKIEIETKHIDDTILIKISDNGKGMSKETQDKIFDPFFTTKPVGEGTGLGLSISYGIIEEHYGDIEVDSTINVGTTFIIKLPVSKLNSVAEAGQ